MKRKLAAFGAALAVSAVALSGCTSDADMVSENLSTAADQFEVQRRIVVFNGITDKILLYVEGKCSITDEGNQLEITCKIGDDEYEKHFAGLSDNVSYFAEQMETLDASVYHTRVIIKPQNLIPQFDLEAGED